jgi:NitT/TauT family transport system substrate-binding protein
MTSEPTPLQTQAEGAGIVVATPSNVAAWSPSNIGPGNITITTKSYAAKNPDVVKKFAQAMQAATKYIHDNEQSTAVTDIAAAELTGIPSDVLKESISQIDWPENGEMTAAQWAAGLKFSVAIGAAKASTTVAEGTDWTNQYLG